MRRYQTLLAPKHQSAPIVGRRPEAAPIVRAERVGNVPPQCGGGQSENRLSERSESPTCRRSAAAGRARTDCPSGASRQRAAAVRRRAEREPIVRAERVGAEGAALDRYVLPYLTG